MWETLGNLGSSLWGAAQPIGGYMFGTAGGPTAGAGNSPLWGQSLMGDIGNLLGSKTGQGALGLGLQGYNI